MPSINEVIQWSEYAMAPLSALALFFCLRMFSKLIPQYWAARSPYRPPGETDQEREALQYSTFQELLSAGFMVGKVILLLTLFLLVFAPWWEPLAGSGRQIVVRIGLDLIIFLMLAHSITRSRYWDRISEMFPVVPIPHPVEDWDKVTERREPHE